MLNNVRRKTASKLPIDFSNAPKKRNSPIVVHLGNVGEAYTPARAIGVIEKECANTEKYAKRFSGIKFVGIDVNQANSKSKNWTQIQEDMLDGLKTLGDSSVSIIRSEMTVGYYSRHGVRVIEKNFAKNIAYAKEVMKVAAEKLKQNGKLVIVADKNTASKLAKLRRTCGFREVKSEFVKNEEAVSFWTERFKRKVHEDGPRKEFMVTLTFIK